MYVLLRKQFYTFSHFLALFISQTSVPHKQVPLFACVFLARRWELQETVFSWLLLLMGISVDMHSWLPLHKASANTVVSSGNAFPLKQNVLWVTFGGVKIRQSQKFAFYITLAVWRAFCLQNLNFFELFSYRGMRVTTQKAVLTSS